MPHLLIGEEGRPIERYLASMASLSSLQPFGWLEGCVLDGLYSLRSVLGTERMESVITAHLGQFLDEDGQLLYEDLHGRKADGLFTTIEATLPLGVIVKLWPNHPVVTRAVAFWDSSGSSAGGPVIDGDTVTAEGSYTVAYPLATVAALLNRQELAEQAIRQVLLRRDWLAEGNHIHLRYHQQTGTHTFRSWARAYAWYMLGMTRTWIELKESRYADLPGVNEIEDELLRVAQAALSWRQPDGLWSCFLDEPETGIDTSGSAGIAAALALGARHGLLPQHCLVAAKESLSSLEPYLTPDGILSGVAQHNAGGLELQRCGYRVMSQMGMGLMAQLYAAIHSD
jgi:rhamnogalacturonyl hydrolase YesR